MHDAPVQDDGAVDLAETDAPNYRRASDGGERCIDCKFNQHVYRSGTETVPSREGTGCRLYAFDSLSGGYKPWFVCDSFEMYDMDRMLYADKALRLAAVGDKQDDGTVWVELIRAGQHHSGRVGGAAASGQKSIDITAEDIESMHRGTAAVLADGRYPTGIPIRLDPMHEDKTGAAFGRVKETEVSRLADGTVRLLGRVKWTDAGANVITAGEYDAVSIEAEPPGTVQSKTTGEPVDDWALTGVVITNHPFVAGMEPLAASEQGAGVERDDMREITKALSLAEDAGESVVLAEIERLRAEASKVDVLERTLSETQEARDTAASRVTDLEAKLTDRLLDDYCEQGRIDAGQRDDIRDALGKMGQEWVERNYRAGAHKVEPKGATGGIDANDESAPKSADDEFESTYQRLLSEGKSATEAYNKAMADHAESIGISYRAERE